MSYDSNNIFAKILRSEIPCDKIYEDEYCLSFYDIQPAAKIHALVIPKFEAESFHDFVLNATPEFVSSFYRSVQKVANKLELKEGGYRVIFNHGNNASQTVFHYHIHILGGEKLKPMN